MVDIGLLATTVQGTATMAAARALGSVLGPAVGNHPARVGNNPTNWPLFGAAFCWEVATGRFCNAKSKGLVEMAVDCRPASIGHRARGNLACPQLGVAQHSPPWSARAEGEDDRVV
jgi:hypothetical protein